MAEIKLADVAKLRKMTMAGMMDCKNALAEADGDMERAVEIIREKGKLVASKRADRNATEGVVVSRVVNGTKGIHALSCLRNRLRGEDRRFRTGCQRDIGDSCEKRCGRPRIAAGDQGGRPYRGRPCFREVGPDGREGGTAFLWPYRGSLLRGVCAHQPQGRFAHRVQQGGTGRARTRCRHAGYRHGTRGY